MISYINGALLPGLGMGWNRNGIKSKWETWIKISCLLNLLESKSKWISFRLMCLLYAEIGMDCFKLLKYPLLLIMIK